VGSSLGSEIALIVDGTASLIQRSREIGIDAAVRESERGLLEESQGSLLQDAAAHVAPPQDPGVLDVLLERIDRALTPDSSPISPPATNAALLHEAGRLRHLRWRAGSELVDLVTAIERLRAATDVSPPESPVRARALTALGTALLDLYGVDGKLTDLDSSVTAYERALEVDGERAMELTAETLSGLASALLERYVRDARIEDIDQAAEVAARAAAITRPEAPELSRRLVALVTALTFRYRRTGLLSDLDAAVDAADRACETVSADPPDGAVMTSCANAKRERYAVTGNLEDLDAAIAAYRDALDQSSPPGTAGHVDAVGNLAAALLERALATEDEADLTNALDLAHRAVDAMADDHPNAVGHLANLALALRIEAGGRETPDAFDEATDTYRRAVELARIREAPVGVLVAGQWGTWAASRSDWPEAAEAYDTALFMRESLIDRAPSWRDRESYLEAAPNLAEDAAYALARAGRVGEALVVLERARVVLLDEALARHGAEARALQDAGHSDLAQAFGSAVTTDLLAELRPSPPEAGSHRPWRGGGVRESLAEIRALPGFETFLRPASLERVIDAARRYPLVYLGASDGGGVAVVVHASGELQDVLLPEASLTAVRDHMSQLLRAHDARKSDDAGWSRALDALLRWTGEAVMAPLLDVVPERRLGMLPMGLLGMVPLQATWTADATAPSGRRYVLDSHVLSYPCSARHLRGTPSPPVFGDRLLRVVGLVDAETELQDRGIEPPMNVVRWGRGLTQLRGQSVSRQTVLAALDRHDVVHFSCATRLDLVEPLTTALLLSDEDRLTVRSILTAASSAPRLVVLPGVWSALHGAALPAELIGLPAAFHAAGASAVVANLSEAPPLATAVLLRTFYRNWRDEPGDPAAALTAAQRQTRDATAEDLAADGFAGEAVPDGAKPFADPANWSGFVCSESA
jgi:tetratricopeptide (TPR) repeat protein